jgi:diadenosine tetraphosphate (Ap4A) HIT family hydrolase
MTQYDSQNIFAKILRGEIPCKKMGENARALAFADIAPQAPSHALVVPKGEYADFADFAARASDEEVVDWVRLAGQTAKTLGLQEGGFRLLVNNGKDAAQEVPHLHLHVVGGGPLGPMLPKGGSQ